jgi:two-component system chemotaxis response regulator CheY
VAPGLVPPEARLVADLTLVLIEPSRVQARIIGKLFEQLGIVRVHVVSSGRQAIETVRQVKARVLFSSMHLADMTGAELATTLRATPEGAGVGFILATSGSEPEQLEAFRQDARTVLLPKPFNLEQLTLAVAQVTGHVPEELAPGD